MDATLKVKVEAMLPLLGEVTFYELLGVDRTATDAQIRRAFHGLAKTYHVDNYSEDLGELREPMQRIFGEVSKAHTVLTDRAKRNEYDASLEMSDRGVPSDLKSIFRADEAFRAGVRLVERNSYDQAYQKLRFACDVNRTEPDYWAYLYWAEYGMLTTDEDGRPQSLSKAAKIRGQLEAVVKDNENCVPARVFLGHIYRVEGDIDQAKRMYKSALALDNTHNEARSSLRILNMRKEKPPTFFERLFGRKK